MPTKLTACIWFDNNAEDAAKFYAGLLPNTHYKIAMHPDKCAPPLTLEVTMMGREYVFLNGGKHFVKNEAHSLMLFCKDQAEIDHYWQALTANGGAASQCGWCRDPFGLSWQIMPENINALTRYPAAFAALMQMTKIDIAALERAVSGAY